MMTRTTPFSARRHVLAVGSALVVLASHAAAAQAEEYDVLIRNGTVFDGSLDARRKADVAIKGDKIVEVGVIPETATATRVIDATGRYVTPGFIDPHNHAVFPGRPGIDTEQLAGAPPLLYEGITSILLNPDGGGPADLKPQVDAIARWTPAVNVAPMIGHNGVRTAVMGLANRKATPAEIAKMSALVKTAMDYGAFCFSTGPFYVPGKYSDTAELVALSKIAAPYKDSCYISHIRDESSYDIGVVNAVKELITVGREAKIKAVVTHQKAIGPDVWGKSKEIVALMQQARADGVDLWADQYPYAASSTGLSASTVPGWAQEGGAKAIADRIKNPETRARMRTEMIDNIRRRGGANAFMIRDYPPDRSVENMRLDEIARKWGKEPVDAALDLLASGNETMVISFNMNEGDVETFMKQPWTMTSSDGELHILGVGAAHPRSYGAFPRKLRHYVIDRKILTWEQAIHSSTGLTATVFNFEGRGFLKPGYFADVLVIDPTTVRDTSTYVKPHSYAVGMDYVLVNGRFEVDHGKVTGARAGRILLRDRKAEATSAGA
ncbi:amidohydrolase family protein [Sphingomonas sp. AP4-R1]|uniref:N-acyl-D-amino-acid deacylase family protein n=1 Tax=Sphingomonas sp. AP4-R1 TaxID=2735134 RepID=UPI001493526A|nr:amidohydrolase family protein [Sphingomonas sp. AP4-R1]QJU59947.1 amidohydrolase family protein [Sphingomonas sp. AP4-R1]